jgi:hypothetical protein
MRNFRLILSLCLLISFEAHARSTDGFFKRFQVIRDNDGKLIGIRDRTLPTKFEVRPYVEMIKNQLTSEQALMSKIGAVNYESDVRELLSEGLAENLTSNSDYEYSVNKVVDSLKELAILNVDGVFKNEVFNDVVSKYEGKLTDALLLLDPTMIAVPNNPKYFYTKNVTYKAVTWALDYAKKKLSNVPVLNTVSYVVVEVEKKITERRTFHQNMLLHYLENFKEEELGLTHDEVNLIWSSIYESRIPWYAIWESNSAKNNWAKYGVNNFFTNYRAASAKLRSNQGKYVEVYDRLNFAFNEVSLEGDKVIVNLFDNESMFKSNPAVAYNYNKTNQVVRKRVMLSLAALGLSFVPVSDFIKENVTNFIKSYYENQRLTEGSLYGYFESNANQSGMIQLKKQYLNPFDITL